MKATRKMMHLLTQRCIFSLADCFVNKWGLENLKFENVHVIKISSHAPFIRGHGAANEYALCPCHYLQTWRLKSHWVKRLHSFSDLVRLAGDKEDGWLRGVRLHVGIHHHWLLFDVQHTLIVQILILDEHNHTHTRNTYFFFLFFCICLE